MRESDHKTSMCFFLPLFMVELWFTVGPGNPRNENEG